MDQRPKLDMREMKTVIKGEDAKVVESMEYRYVGV